MFFLPLFSFDEFDEEKNDRDGEEDETNPFSEEDGGDHKAEEEGVFTRLKGSALIEEVPSPDDHGDEGDVEDEPAAVGEDDGEEPKNDGSEKTGVFVFIEFAAEEVDASESG